MISIIILSVLLFISLLINFNQMRKQEALESYIEELENSKRIYKSATPKYTLDWYIKWVASVFVLAAMSMRGIPELQMWDLGLSVIGITLWLWVSFLWKDRALILLNGVGLMFLLRNFFTSFNGLQIQKIVI